MKKKTAAPRRRKPRFDIESTSVADRINRFAYEEPYRIAAGESYATIAGTLPTPHGFVLFNGIKAPSQERQSTQMRFICRGRIYIGSVAGFCPERHQVRGIAERFAEACTKLKAQDVDGARGILK